VNGLALHEEVVDTSAGDYTQSIESHHRASLVIPGGVNSVFRSRGEPCPLTFVRGFGSHLIDVDGTEYIDYALGMGPNILGHAPSAVVDAVTQATQVGQLFAGQHPVETELAELLVEVIPSAERVRFGQSGTEMDQLAIRLARAHTRRQRIVRFSGHYHGWLDPLFIDAGQGQDGSPTLSPGQSVAASKDVVVVPWNDSEALDAVFRAVDHDIAAVIMEPIMCNTGVILPRSGYLERVRELCDQAGAVLIFDEVITGFRVDLRGAQGYLGVRPDLATFAKAIASGYPVGVIAGRADIMELLATGGVVHGGTFNTGLSAMAAAVATLKALLSDDFYPRLFEQGQTLMDKILTAATEIGVELSVEGLGAVFHTRFGPPGGVTDLKTFNERSSVGATQAFVRALQDRRVRIPSRGTWFLSAAHTADDIHSTADAVRGALEQLVRDDVVATA
jgi:glutamate-1-semialdehyde 2,1-aminomutase